MTCQLRSILSLTLQCILTQTDEQGGFWPLIISWHYSSISHLMHRPGTFSLAGKHPHWSVLPVALGQESCGVVYWILSAMTVHRSKLQSNQTCLAHIRDNQCGWKLCALLNNKLPRWCDITALSKVNPLSSIASSINSRLMCNPTKDFMSGSLVMSCKGVMQPKWLDLE